MSILKDIVASFELCQKIPKGQFNETALIYGWPIEDGGSGLIQRDGEKPVVFTPELYAVWKEVAPAPTLEDVMPRFPLFIKENKNGDAFELYTSWNTGAFSIGYMRETKKCLHLCMNEVADLSEEPAVAAALRLWFRLNKIEVK